MKVVPVGPLTPEDSSRGLVDNAEKWPDIDFTEKLEGLTLEIIQSTSINVQIISCATIQPDSYPRLIWDIVGAVLILYQSIQIPLKLGFGSVIPPTRHGIDQFDPVIDIFFLIDIGKIIFIKFEVLNTQTSFYFKGTLVISRKQVMLHYLKTWFLADLVASFPYTWLLGTTYEFEPSLSDSQEFQLYNNQRSSG